MDNGVGSGGGGGGDGCGLDGGGRGRGGEGGGSWCLVWKVINAINGSSTELEDGGAYDELDGVCLDQRECVWIRESVLFFLFKGVC